jgi:predicted DCC family thiol-disulfide oxidoreductase YuxK
VESKISNVVINRASRGKVQMNQSDSKICVYYDGACPGCVKDRRNYERLLGKSKDDVQWIDITGKDDLLRSIGIDPNKALMELHVSNENQQILSEIDAYILLMNKVPVLKPLAKIVGLLLIRKGLSKAYRRRVKRRLRRSGRLEE